MSNDRETQYEAAREALRPYETEPYGDLRLNAARAAGIALRAALVNGWIATETDGCTCGTNGLHGAHEHGCGLEPLVEVGAAAEPLAAEHNAVVAERDALRDTVGARDEALRLARASGLMEAAQIVEDIQAQGLGLDSAARAIERAAGQPR